MQIEAVEFFPLKIALDAPFKPAWSPGVTVTTRDGTLIRVRTDDGITGYGWQNSRGAEVKDLGESKFFKDRVVGLQVYEIERVIKLLSGFDTKMYGVEVAMWDALGKSVKMPIHRLLGGAQDKVMAYASTAQLKSPEQHATDALRYWEMGFHAIKIRSHNETMEEDVAVIKAVRRAVPAEMAIMVDANQSNPTVGPVWSQKRALKTARELEKLDVLWLEEPLHHQAYEDLAMLRSEVDLFIAGGEDEVGLFRFKELLTRGCFDIVQPDVCSSGGILQLRKIAAVAESMNRLLIPHSFDTGITLASALQVIGSCPNSPYIEYAMELPALDQGHDKLLKTPIDVGRDGFVKIPDGPGLGVEIDEGVIRKYGA